MTTEESRPGKRSVLPLRRGARGQSLIEFALSITVLVLVFSDAVDLGRAFFTRINLDSTIGEGAHWAAAYPGCLKYGVDQNPTTSSNVDIHCAGTNSILGRMLTENDMLVGSSIKHTELVYVAPVGCITGCTKTLDQLVAGDTVKMS